MKLVIVLVGFFLYSNSWAQTQLVILRPTALGKPLNQTNVLLSDGAIHPSAVSLEINSKGALSGAVLTYPSTVSFKQMRDHLIGQYGTNVASEFEEGELLTWRLAEHSTVLTLGLDGKYVQVMYLHRVAKEGKENTPSKIQP